MKILMAAGEMAPFVRIGALADSIAELSGELRKLGHDVTVALPFYRVIREDKAVKFKKTKTKFSVQVGGNRMPCEIFEAKAPNGVRVLFVSRDEYFDRSGIYGTEGRDYQDNAARFIFFTKCVLELARRMETPPDVVHVNSWETALAPVLARDQRLPFRTVLTPHALEFQGNFWSYDFALTNLPGDYFSARGVEYFGSMNCLKAGILFSDAVVFSSERMVCAVQTPEHGCGLDAVLRENQHKLTGIFSPAGLETWNPESDADLAAKFSAAKPAGRVKNRAALLKQFELEETPGAIFATFVEASGGAGMDILFDSLDRLLAGGERLILHGPVAAEHTFALEVARRKHRGRFVHVVEPDEKLARMTLAGADALLVPGNAEPGAVWLKRALAYGAVPVARQCGGLFQLVRDWEPRRDVGNGFVFYSATTDGLVDVCRRAAKAFADPAVRERLMATGMRTDFSSAGMARGHEALYERLLGVSHRAEAA